MRRQRPTTARTPEFGVVGSLVFHGLIVAGTFLSLSHNFKPAQEIHMVPVDLVTVADKTNVTAQAPPTPPEPPKMDMPQPQEVQPLEPRMQVAEPAPVPPVPKFKVEEDKPKPDEDNKPKTKKDQQKDFASLLDKLTTPDKPVKNAKAGARTIQAVGAGNQMTADLITALSNQVYRCFSPPSGVPNPNDLVVDFSFNLNPDGTVVGRPQLLTTGGNSYTRASADAASRAITGCQPYHLPQNRYEEWREISRMHFDPRQMEQ